MTILTAVIIALVLIIGSAALAAALLHMGNEYDRDLDRYFNPNKHDREG